MPPVMSLSPRAGLPGARRSDPPRTSRLQEERMRRETLAGASRGLNLMPCDQAMSLYEVFRDNITLHEMLLNDSFEHRRIALCVPRPFRVDDRDRPSFADAETVGFRAENPSLFGEPELFEAPLQEFPCGKPALFFAAFRRRLVAAEKNVPARHRDADLCRDLLLRVGHAVGRWHQNSFTSTIVPCSTASVSAGISM